jgi:hypothetical protein
VRGSIGYVTPELAAAATKWPLYELETAWSTCPKTLRRARVLELSGWAFYVAGRGGVLGDTARPDTVAAAIGIINPDAVRAGWEAARKVGSGEVAASRLAECARWGDENLARLKEVDRLVQLAERVIIAADAVAMPLFAATRSMPVPDGGPGARAAVLAHLMRELRAGALLLAGRSCGLRPVEMIIAGPDGEEEAITFGWQPPFPARTPLMRRFLFAEALADRIAGQAYSVLDVGERVDLVRVLTAAADVAKSTRQ